MEKHTTEKLTDILKNTSTADGLLEYMDKLEEKPVYDSFQEYFNALPQADSIGKAELIRRAGIERSYGYQLLKGTRSPGRDKILLLCMAAQLDLHATQRALECAGESVLYPRKKRDAIIIFAIKENLSIADTQELLDQFGEMTLENMKSF